jgi:predicted ferric reductase
MKNAVFWDDTQRGSCKNRYFRRVYRLHHQGGKNRRVLRLLVTANVPRSPFLVTLMRQAIRSSEISRFLPEPHGVISLRVVFLKKWRIAYQLWAYFMRAPLRPLLIFACHLYLSLSNLFFFFMHSSSSHCCYIPIPHSSSL